MPVVKAADGTFYVRADPTLKNNLTMAVPATAATTTWACGKQYPPAGAELQDGSESHYVSGAYATPPDQPPFTREDDPSQSLLVSGGVVYLPPRTGNATLSGIQVDTWGGASILTGSGSPVTYDYQVLADGVTPILPSGGAITIPDTVNTFEIQVRAPGTHSSTGQEGFLKSFEWYLTMPQIASTTSTNCIRVASDITDYSALTASDEKSQLCEQYRVVAQSLLVSYQGDSQSDGGQIAGVRTVGGQDPDDEGWIDYASIASISNQNQNAYEDAVKFGGYGFWAGSDEKDYAYRNPSVVNRSQLPCLVCAGKLDTAASTLRARLVTIVEWKTSKSFIPTTPSIINSQMMEEANRAISRFPAWHCNPNHKKDIKSFFEDVLDFGSKVYNTVNQGIQNSVGSIGPLLGVLGGLGPAMGGALGPLAPLLAFL